jgi:hypothetical protein
LAYASFHCSSVSISFHAAISIAPLKLMLLGLFYHTWFLKACLTKVIRVVT